MPRPKRDYQLVLYGPDRKYGAKPRKGFKQYLWYIVWHEDGRKRERTTGKADFSAAEEFVHNDWLPSRIEKPDGPREPREMYVATALSLYGEEHAPHVADPERIGYAIDALVPYWGEKWCSQVTRTTCREYEKNRIDAGAASSTARKELGTLQAALNYSHEAGYLTQPPKVTLPAKTASKERWATRSEVAALIRAARAEPKARDHLPLFILMAVYTGARTQSILHLQWQENPSGGWVDLRAERIFWKPLNYKETKKQRAHGTPIPRRLLHMLKYQRKRTRTFVFEIDGKWAGDNRHAFATAREKAWVEKDEKGEPIRGVLKDVTRHTLKHTCITWLMQKGVPDWEVSGYTGTSLDTIRRVYAHHAPDHLELARKAFD